jgi:hypothetical protein
MANKTLSDAIVEAAHTGKNPPEIGVLVSGATIANGTTVANITAAEESHDLNETFSDTEVEAALDALGAKINLLIAALEEFNVSASA